MAAALAWVTAILVAGFAISPLPSAYAARRDGVGARHVGALLGLQAPTGAGAKDLFSYGVTLGYRFEPDLSLGLRFFLGSDSDESGSGASVTRNSSRNAFVLADGNYHFGGQFSERLTFGLSLGLAMPSTKVTVNGVELLNDSTTHLALGARAGYDYPIEDRYSVGAEVNYLGVTGSTTADPYLNFLASFKYWF